VFVRSTFFSMVRDSDRRLRFHVHVPFRSRLRLRRGVRTGSACRRFPVSDRPRTSRGFGFVFSSFSLRRVLEGGATSTASSACASGRDGLVAVRSIDAKDPRRGRGFVSAPAVPFGGRDRVVALGRPRSILGSLSFHPRLCIAFLLRRTWSVEVPPSIRCLVRIRRRVVVRLGWTPSSSSFGCWFHDPHLCRLSFFHLCFLGPHHVSLLPDVPFQPPYLFRQVPVGFHADHGSCETEGDGCTEFDRDLWMGVLFLPTPSFCWMVVGGEGILPLGERETWIQGPPSSLGSIPFCLSPHPDRTGWETGSIDRSIDRKGPRFLPPFSFLPSFLPSSLPREGGRGDRERQPPTTTSTTPTTDVDMAPKKKDAPKEEAPVLGRFSSHLKVRNHVRPIPENQRKKIMERTRCERTRTNRRRHQRQPEEGNRRGTSKIRTSCDP